ncbi:hypothetical protein AB0J38_26605 [Streptomyces sp. NPDC050095]|uniref:hypothetical protein n=1 Tax=unclassified Streptomyces TaxID=2593676 RepID=UPI0034301633
MGLILFPGNRDDGTPDVSWSCRGFHEFRTWLAQAEGFALAEMRGFGGERAWSGVSSVLKPLLDHPDTGGDDLTSADCAAMAPRLAEIAAAVPREEYRTSPRPAVHRHAEDARRLIAVMDVCVAEQVELIFL